MTQATREQTFLNERIKEFIRDLQSQEKDDLEIVSEVIALGIDAMIEIWEAENKDTEQLRYLMHLIDESIEKVELI